VRLENRFRGGFLLGDSEGSPLAVYIGALAVSFALALAVYRLVRGSGRRR
jgi:hypothetical protein